MDLADVGGNVKHGAHIASIGGTWMAIVYGFAVLRDTDGRISFHPRLPERLERIRFALTIRGQELVVDATQDTVTYLLQQGSALTIAHQGKDFELGVGIPVSVRLK
jgi:alpha,alpha-trehalose phosphorylase